jgi:hypothetical protein
MHVLRIDAAAIAAGMPDPEPCGNIAVVQAPGNAVSLLRLFAIPHLAVAARILGGLPVPAAGRFVDGEFGFESVAH